MTQQLRRAAVALLVLGECIAFVRFREIAPWNLLDYLALLLIWGVWIVFLHFWGLALFRGLFADFASKADGVELWGWSMVFGTCAAILVPFVAVSAEVRGVVLSALLLAGWFLPPLFFRGRREKSWLGEARAGLRDLFEKGRGWERAVAIGFLVVLLARFLTALQIKTHGDVFAYHLYGPASWYLFGGHFDASRPITYQSGAWEYLYVWAFPLFHWPAREGGWIAAQLFGQLTHTYLGFLGCAFAVTRLLPRAGPANRMGVASKLMITLVALNYNSALVTLPTAKNDWGAAFLPLAAIAGLERFGASGRGAVFWWLLLGFGFSLKFTGVFLIVPAAAYYGWRKIREKAPLSAWVEMAVGLAAGGLLIPLRNGWGTGNPLFPTMNDLFKSSAVSPFVEQVTHMVEGGGNALSGHGLWGAGSAFFHQNPAFIFLLAAPALLRLKKLDRRWLAMTGIAAGGVLFFGLKGAQEPRYLLPCGILMGAMAGQAAEAAGRLFGKHAPWIWLAVVPMLNIPLYVFPQLFTKYVNPFTAVTRVVTGAEAKMWVRAHLDARSVVLLSNDAELYYLARYRIFDPMWHVKAERILSHPEEFACATQALLNLGVTHLLLDRLSYGPDVFIEPRLGKRVANCPRAVLFRNEVSRVVDLTALQTCTPSSELCR